MMRWLRRLFWLGVIAGGGYGGYRVWSRRHSSPPTTPQWPPLPSEERVDEAVSTTLRWVAPIDGGCPEAYPVKANDNSGIFHVPTGRFYARTVPERCYANADDAIADGYRPAKA
jgi:hypothetical protein